MSRFFAGWNAKKDFKKMDLIERISINFIYKFIFVYFILLVLNFLQFQNAAEFNCNTNYCGINCISIYSYIFYYSSPAEA